VKPRMLQTAKGILFMKYDPDSAFLESMRRSEGIRQRKERRKQAFLTGSTAVLSILLIAVMFSLNTTGYAGRPQSAYGSFLLFAGTGGYVLVAVIAFTAGVTATFLTLKYRDKGKKDK